MGNLALDAQPKKVETRAQVQVGAGYIRRQKWTHPLVSSASAILPAVIQALSIPSAKFYTFTVSSANATAGATFTNNGITYTVFIPSQAAQRYMLAVTVHRLHQVQLTKASGTGDSTITFSAATNGLGQPDFSASSEHYRHRQHSHC